MKFSFSNTTFQDDRVKQGYPTIQTTLFFINFTLVIENIPKKYFSFYNTILHVDIYIRKLMI